MPRVLIVDDDLTFQTAMGAKLRDNGYDVELALNGASALVRLDENRPDVILLDLKMPKMDGMAFLRQLQADRPADTRIPVFITSNLSGIDKVSEGLELGVRGYIIKSDESLDTIASAVDSVCHRGGKIGEPGSPSNP